MVKNSFAANAGLRRRAEEQLGELARTDGGARSPEDPQRLVHELQVHQIELEMQNEELLRSRSELEAAVERYASLYEDLYDFAPVGYVTVDRGGAVQKANLTAARMVGVVRSEIVGHPLRLSVAVADRPAFDAALTNALAHKTEQSCEVELAPAPGAASDRHYVQLTISASEHDDERRVVLVDVTERRRSDEQLRAWQKMEAIGRLAGGVAHDFNNLLTVILTNAAVAQKHAAANGPLDDELTEIRLAAERAAGLTRQLLALGRKDVARPQLIDINQCVRGVMQLVAFNDLLELDVVLAPDLGHVAADPIQFEQMVMNLAFNARDAMPRGGKLTVTTANADVDEERARQSPALRSGPYVVVSVSDTGVGMDKATVAHIFEPFFTTKEIASGTGLGLAIVHGIVARCGGHITVRSEPARGSTFEVFLPRAPADRAHAPVVPAEKTKAPATGTETILILDDEPGVRGIAKRILASAGYSVLVAASGAEALAACKEHAGTIHLALSDVVMPEMNGLVFAEHLKSIRPDTTVLHMSGYAADAISTNGTLDEARFLSKPFGAKALLEKVREVLDTARPVAQRER